MSDWFSTATEMQREILRAQRAQIDIGRQMLDAGQRMTAMQEAGQKAVEANVAAWQAWQDFWGVRR